MVFGNGGGSFEPHSEWYVANNGSSVALVLLALLLLSVLLILVTSAASFFRDLSLVAMRDDHFTCVFYEKGSSSENEEIWACLPVLDAYT